jgi:ketosteroid isomerase-like protein
MLTTIAAVLAAAPCASVEETAAVKAKIDAANATAQASLAAGDYAAYAAHFTEDAWQMPPNSPVSRGRAAIEAFWTETGALFAYDLRLEALEVTLCGPHAVERGAYTFTLTPQPDGPEGLPTLEDRGHYLVHWKKVGEQWLIYSDAPVSSMPLPGME